MSARTVDEYLAGYDGEVRDRLERVRAAIRSVLPDAEESIRYGMPAVRYRHEYLYYAAWKNHIGLYPVYRSDEPVEAEIIPYRDGTDTLRFPYDREQPDELIARIAAFLSRPRR